MPIPLIINILHKCALTLPVIEAAKDENQLA